LFKSISFHCLAVISLTCLNNSSCAAPHFNDLYADAALLTQSAESLYIFSKLSSSVIIFLSASLASFNFFNVSSVIVLSNFSEAFLTHFFTTESILVFHQAHHLSNILLSS
jgi:hypothetical protein